MKRTALGVVQATLAMFVWGMAYWGANPLPYRAWKSAVDDEVAQRVLREQFPEVGTYAVPSLRADPETLARRYLAGPAGFLHITSRGRPVHDMSIMAKGLFLDLLSVLAMAGLLRMAAPSLPTYRRRASFAALAALGAAVLIDGGDVAWWSIPWPWKLHQAVYDASVWWVAGLSSRASRTKASPRVRRGRNGLPRPALRSLGTTVNLCA